MGYYHNQWSYTSPSGTTDITLNSSRNGTNIVVNATVTCAFEYSSDYIAYDGEINFNMWSGSVNSSANIKGYSDRWYYSGGASRTRTCSMTISSTSSSVDVSFNVTVPAGNSRFAVSTTTVTLGDTPYTNPTAPTWINVTPNPCSISSAPVVTWGGATAGSSGVLVYDVEVRQTTTSGAWTEWYRLSNSQSATSYTASTISNTTIYGNTAFSGVIYQYKVRVWDSAASVASDWITSSNVTVTFGTPTPPTTYTWSKTKVKLDEKFTLTWNSGSAGSGSLEGYEVTTRLYLTNTEGFTKNAWTNWSTNSVKSTRSESFVFDSNLFNPGDLMQARIRTKNSYGQYSSYLYTSYVTVAEDGVIYIKINDTWREGTPYIKINDTWREGTPYIKINDTWREAT